jgi:nucleoside-diphosphate-sugar epimerase
MGYGLTWRLLAAGHAVAHLNRGSFPDPFGERIERLRGDRASDDFDRLLRGRRFDAVVDFAAFRGADVARALRVLRGSGAHYVLISTGQVYLVREGCAVPARETDYAGPLLPAPADPRDKAEWDYGVGKRQCEDALAAAWERDGFPATRLRIPMVDGERDPQRRLEGYLWRILDGGPLLLPDGGARAVRHVYAGAVVRAIAELLGRSDTYGQAYNLSQDEMPTLREFCTLLAEVLGAPARLVDVPEAEIRAAGLETKAVSPFSVRWMSCIDPARAKAELGFRHEPLREYVGRIVAAFLARLPAEPPPGYAQRAGELQLAARLPLSS